MKRVLSLVLSLVMAFSIITGMDVSVFAADEFSANKYLAQLSFGDEYIPYQTLESFYYDYQTGCEIVVDAAKNTSLESDIAAWYAIKSVANPGNAIDALNYQQQYELILYNVIFDALCSEQVEEYNYENSISKVSEFTNTIVESWNSADILDKTDLTGAESEAIKDAAMTFLGKSDTKWTALGEYSAIVNELAVCIESIITIGVDVVEIIDRVAIMVQLMDVGDAVISFLYDIKANAGDVFLASAAQEVIDSISYDWVGIVEKVVTDVGFSFGKIATERLVNLAWGQVCSVVPFCAGMVIGDVVGTTACNVLFATEDTVEEYSNMKKFIEVMSAAKTAFSSTASACRNNINDDTAAKWIFSCDFMYSLIVSDYKCSVKFFEIINTKGLVNKVKNFFGGSGYEKYESFCDSVNGILNSYESVYESFYKAWPIFMEEDHPDIYDSYIQKMNHPFETIITEVTSVDFIKDEYELAMNQTVKIPAMAYPTTAKNTGLTYSSSNTNVISVSSDGTITPVGEGTANVIATASNGVKGYCKITVYPYNVRENDTGYTINEYLGSATNVSIPYEINGIDVTVIGNAAFKSDTNITSVVIPNSIMSINLFAFQDCTSLSSVLIGSNVTQIGNSAFYNCDNLTSITIPDSVEIIEIAAFFSCDSLEKVVLSSSITSVAMNTFKNCVSLSSIVIPEGVKEIVRGAFSGCTSLFEVTLPSTLANLGEQAGLFDYAQDGAFEGCSALVSINLPNSIEKIGKETFKKCTSLKSVVLSDNLISIDEEAFYNCSSLESIVIPDSVTTLGCRAFTNCTSLESVILSDNIDRLHTDTLTSTADVGLFENCSNLTYVEIGKNTTTIGPRCFKNCTSLAEINIPDNVTGISEYAFYNCSNLSTVILGDGVEGIGEGSFAGCSKLDYISFGNNINSIRRFAFSETKPSKVNVSNLSVWCYVAFESEESNPMWQGGNLYLNDELVTKLEIPSDITSIGSFAFNNCSSIERLIVPENISSINGYAFSNCDNLVDVEFLGEDVSFGISCFEDCDSLVSVKLPEKLNAIASKVFLSCDNLKNISLPDTLTSIGSFAFSACKKLDSVDIPESVTSIGNSAFSYCDSLTSVNIPGSVTTINQNVFESCGNLKSILISDGVTSIKSNAFANCSALERIEIPNSVEIIDTTAFINDTKTVIYCQKNSSAHTFAIDNNIPFIADDDNTSVDLKKHLIFTNYANTDISEIMALSQGLTYIINGDISGTGAKVNVMKDDELHSQYTLVVSGDTNGDSVCNVLDVSEAERASNGHLELEGTYAMAADSNSDDTIDINDYQAIVNKALAS